jgi:cation:H+ antiporter
MLYVGAELLVRGSSELARRFGLSALVVGLTVVAFGTSAPELAVSVGAAVKGKSDIALGNVIGSNIANVGLILGSAALIQNLLIRAELIRLDMRVMILVSIVVPVLLMDGSISRIEGFLLFSALAAYLTYTVVLARRARATVKAEFRDAIPLPVRSPWLDLIMITGGVILLVAGAEALVFGAVKVAQQYQISTAIIGLTIVALGTSLPELATSIVAAIRREGDLVVGNVVGSNIFNLLGIVGVSSMVSPITPKAIAVPDFLVMIGVSILLLALMRSGKRLNRVEGASLCLAYLGYIAYLATRITG